MILCVSLSIPRWVTPADTQERALALWDGGNGERPRVEPTRVVAGQVLDKKLPLPRGRGVGEGCHRNVDQDDIVLAAACAVVQDGAGTRRRNQCHDQVAFVGVADVC